MSFVASKIAAGHNTHHTRERKGRGGGSARWTLRDTKGGTNGGREGGEEWVREGVRQEEGGTIELPRLKVWLQVPMFPPPVEVAGSEVRHDEDNLLHRKIDGLLHLDEGLKHKEAELAAARS